MTTRTGDTKHAVDCKRVFSRYDAACPRCQELMAGGKARAGWQTGYFARKAQRDAQHLAGIDAHFKSEAHLSGACGPVCTFGEW
jgi:hypothetical protein